MLRLYTALFCFMLVAAEVRGAVPPPYGENTLCSSELTAALREITETISSSSRSCRVDDRERKAASADADMIVQTLRQNGEVIGSLLSQTESLKLALASVAEVQSGQQQLVVALKTELESEKQAKRTLRRTVHDLRSELHTVKKETMAWREHLSRLETEIKAGLQKSELAAQEATIEVKSTGERVNSLGEVIRHVQGTLQGLGKTVTKHTSHFVSLRRNRVKIPEQPTEKENTTEDTDSENVLERPDEDMHCPHPYTRIGLGCFTVHSTLRYSWDRARQHCKEFNGDLANPYDLYDIVLFLDESFPDSMYSTSGGWGFWVGATLQDDGKWQWVSGVPVTVQVDFWGRGEPGEPLDSNERCLFLHSWWRFRAGADPCDSKKYFICELKTTSSSN